MTLEHILPFVEKPSRYIGTEVNAVRKDKTSCRLHFALAFPDTYEVGMSHLGLQILYSILNNHPEVYAERCYAPWPDMEKRMRQHGIPLCTMESHTPLKDFDVVGFSLQYELSYTNVLNMLDMGGIPLHSKDRSNEDPLVIAGGPCTFNPAPMSTFIDAFVIGEGEDVISEITALLLKLKERTINRREILEKLTEIEGIYVPATHNGNRIVRKRTVADIDACQYPMQPLVPLMKTIHDRATIEIARGCTRGCRFCQAGMVWRPVRERTTGKVKEIAEQMLCATGHEELSLLSLSSGDYGMIEPLLAELMERYYEKRIAIGLPSLRVETLTERLIEEIKRVRKTSFTLAPEAGTQRLRNIINKGNTEADLLATTGRVFDAGWRAVKLYFMLGLPGETQDDLEGIVDLGYKVIKTAGNRGQVTISLSTFVPKSHTPFQWYSQIGIDETIQKQDFLKRNTRHRNLSVKWHDSRMSLLEGIFARGDEESGNLIESAFRLGCRFDGWTDRLRFDIWGNVLKEANHPHDYYLRARSTAETLPWSFIDAGVNRDFLIKECEKSAGGELTADCRIEKCYNCGACDHDLIKTVTAHPATVTDNMPSQIKKRDIVSGSPTVGRFLIRFSKKGLSRFLSHLELSAALIRAIKQSGLHFVFSQGFHPHPKISFTFATSVGMESNGEYAEIQLYKPVATTEIMMPKINSFLPAGVEITEIVEKPSYAPPLSDMVRGFKYLIHFPAGSSMDAAALSGKIAQFMKQETFTIIRETKGKTTTKNIRPLVMELALQEETGCLTITSRFSQEGTVRPLDILTQILGFDKETANLLRIVKTDTLFRHG